MQYRTVEKVEEGTGPDLSLHFKCWPQDPCTSCPAILQLYTRISYCSILEAGNGARLLSELPLSYSIVPVYVGNAGQEQPMFACSPNGGFSHQPHPG
jgi:hypothetical protein